MVSSPTAVSNVRAVARGDHARAAIKLRNNRQRDEHGKYQANQRVEISEAERKCNRARDHATHKRPRKIAPQRIERSLAPSEQRTHAREEQQKQRDRNVHLIEERRAHADFAARHPFGEHGEKRSPKNGEASGQENQIVEEEARFARDERIELIVAAQIIAILVPGREADDQNDREKADRTSRRWTIPRMRARN